MGLFESAVEVVAEDMLGAVVSPPVVAVGTLIAVPVLFPQVARRLRPLAKGAVKGTLIVYDKGKEVFTDFGEQWSDLVAESRAELVTAGTAVTAAEAVTEEEKAEKQTKPRTRRSTAAAEATT